MSLVSYDIAQRVAVLEKQHKETSQRLAATAEQQADLARRVDRLERLSYLLHRYVVRNITSAEVEEMGILVDNIRIDRDTRIILRTEE